MLGTGGQTMSYRSLNEEEMFVNAIDTEIICNEKYCPWHKKHICSPRNPNCEGNYCEEAWENYCDENDMEFET
jgi:hypothetical protein